MKIKPAFWILGIGLIGLVLVFLLVPRTSQEEARRRKILTAIKTYQSEYGKLPPSENLGLAQALSGENPMKIRFLDISSMVDTNGMLVSSNGSYYVFEFGPNNEIVISDLKSKASSQP